MPEEFEEINLWDYVVVLRKRMWLILAVFLSATAISALLSFFILSPIYEARVSLMIQGQEALGLPQWSLETYSNILKGSALVRDVATKAGLPVGPAEIERLAKRAEVEIVKDTNILRLKVRDKSPQEAAELANLWARSFTSRVRDLKMVELERTLRLTNASITALTNELIKTSPTIKLRRALVEDPILYEAVRSRLSKDIQEVVGLTITVEEPNPRYLSLEADLTNKRISVESLKTAAVLLEKEPETCVRLLSPAMPPASPVAPRKLLNTAVAATLGLMVGTMLAFAIEALEAGTAKNSTLAPSEAPGS